MRDNYKVYIEENGKSKPRLLLKSHQIIDIK